MRNLEARARVYGEREARGWCLNSGDRPLAAIVEQAFRDGAMIAEAESGQRGAPRIVIKANNVGDAERLILAESLAEDSEHARGYNMGLRKAVSMLAERSTAKVPELTAEVAP